MGVKTTMSKTWLNFDLHCSGEVVLITKQTK